MKANNQTCIVFVRHGPTEWNAAGRIQGHTDVPLSAAGRRSVEHWRVPKAYGTATWVCSPLIRAVQTANLMGCAKPDIEPLLIEMNWGDWEGHTLDQLRADHGAEMARNEERGLDFRPHGGESPLQVRGRLQTWIAHIAETHQPYIAVTHKGVIRAALSLATGWDMGNEPPVRLRWDCAHVFVLNDADGLSLHTANVPLVS